VRQNLEIMNGAAVAIAREGSPIPLRVAQRR